VTLEWLLVTGLGIAASAVTGAWRFHVWLDGRRKARLAEAARVDAALSKAEAAQLAAANAVDKANEVGGDLADFREHVARTYHDRDELRLMFADLKETVTGGLREVRELVISRLSRP
jgi:hypothetical protein